MNLQLYLVETLKELVHRSARGGFTPPPYASGPMQVMYTLMIDNYKPDFFVFLNIFFL